MTASGRSSRARRGYVGSALRPALLASLSPQGTGVHETLNRSTGERSDIAPAGMDVPRRQEFARGRRCARTALTAVGGPAVDIPIGRHGAPVWPPGFTGSITHTGAYCGAVAASTSEFRALGIDAEDRTADVLTHLGLVCHAEETEWVMAGDASLRALAAFVMKESAYKAWHALFETVLGPRDIRVVSGPDSEFDAEACDRLGNRHTLSGRWAADEARVAAVCWEAAR